MLILLCENESLKLSKSESIKLELKFNLTNKGKEWSELGDLLYEYGVSSNVLDKKIILDKNKWQYLLDLYLSMNNQPE